MAYGSSDNYNATKSYIIEYKGIFDLEGLYRLIIRWLQDRAFEFHEDTYKHKPGMVGKEQEIKMSAWLKFNDYIRYNFAIYIHVWDMQEVEVVRDNQKVIMIKGRIRIVLDASVDRDWQGQWKKTKTLRRLRAFYDKYVIFKDNAGVWGDMLHYKLVKLHNEIKEYLGMETPSRTYYNYMGPDQGG